MNIFIETQVGGVYPSLLFRHHNFLSSNDMIGWNAPFTVSAQYFFFFLIQTDVKVLCDVRIAKLLDVRYGNTFHLFNWELRRLGQVYTMIDYCFTCSSIFKLITKIMIQLVLINTNWNFYWFRELITHII